MKGNKIFKATFVVMIVTLLSRVLGMVRDILVASNFGAGVYTDAYKAAVSIPDNLFTIIGLAISTVFIPMISKVKYEKGKEEMFKFSNNIISILSAISVLLLVFGLIFTKDLVKIVATGFDQERMDLAITLTKISLINLLFLSINVCFLSMLQVCEKFILPSILGLFLNLPMIIYLVLFKDISILGLTVANVIGNALRVVVQIPALYKEGYRIIPHINLKDERIKRVLILVVPVIVGAGANSLNMIVDLNISSTLDVGSMSALDYAQKIIVFINTAITTSIVSVLYPVMSTKLNEGDNEGFLTYLCKSIVIISLLLIPIAFAIILLNKEIVTAFYGRNQFGASAITLTSIALLGYSMQIPFLGVRDILNSSLFSMQKTKITTINGVIGFVVNIVLSITLSRKIGLLGVAIASSIASAVTAILLFYSTKKVIGNIDLRDMLKSLSKITISAFIMIFIVKIVNDFLGISNPFMVLIIDGAIGSIVFFTGCIVLRVKELKEILDMLLKKFIRKEVR